jgi:hypothetical protein
MRLPGVLAALAAALLIPATAAAADPLGTPSRLVSVGPGTSETAQRQVVRTADGVVYIASVDDDGYGDHTPAELHMYRATTAGVPSAFASADEADDPRVDDPFDMSGGDARIDSAGTIHVTYVVADLSDGSATVRYQTFDTRDDQWGRAQDVAKLDADGDGVRGKVISALALDPAGKPLVVTASAGGVSAWSPADDGGWTRAAIDADRALHPSLAFDASGRALLSWLSAPYDDAGIRYASRAPDGTWSKPETVAGGTDVLTNSTSDQGPSLAYDSEGRPVVLWLDRLDFVRVAVRSDRGWTRADPPLVFSHSPALYVRGEERLAFLGHDALTHPAYLSQATDAAQWSSVGVFPPPPSVDGFYAYDGSASPRFDPLFDPDCRIVDVAFFAEYSYQAGRIGKPDLYYAAVTLPEPAGGCPKPGASDPPPASSPPPAGDPPADDPPPASEPPPADDPPPASSPPPADDPPPASDPPPADDPPPAQTPPAAATTLLGEDQIGPQTDGNRSGMAEAFQAAADKTGTVGSIKVYIDASSTGERVVVGLYTDDGGHPGALLTQGAVAAKADGWNAVDVAGAELTAGQRYWVALLGTGTGQIAFRDQPDACTSETTPDSLVLDALPKTWTTGATWDDCPLSAYAVGA